MRFKRLILAVSIVFCAATFASAKDGAARTIIYNGAVTAVSAAPDAIGGASAESSLWITTADLTRATGYEVKPQGVCHEEICFPIPKDRKARLLHTAGGTNWFNLIEFARMIHQPVAEDAAHQVWYFGNRMQTQNDFVDSLKAPDFTLPDAEGKMHSLSDFRGKKVLLITWASW